MNRTTNHLYKKYNCYNNNFNACNLCKHCNQKCCYSNSSLLDSLYCVENFLCCTQKFLFCVNFSECSNKKDTSCHSLLIKFCENSTSPSLNLRFASPFINIFTEFTSVNSVTVLTIQFIVLFSSSLPPT